MAIEPAATCTEFIDEPQKRLMVAAPTVCGSPANSSAIRPTLLPCSPSG